jgi:lipid II:glycine glycyltransferase (peptidoglycan interpeptide bridge formation enzyme)
MNIAVIPARGGSKRIPRKNIGDMVTGAYFIYNSVSSYYGVSASKRELFSKPISHALLWQAILKAKSLGCRYFEMGEQLYCNQGSHTKKELDISKFKKEFGGKTDVRMNIKWDKTTDIQADI